MNLLDQYIKKNRDIGWFDLFSRTGTGTHGKCFECFSTNMRTLQTYISYFRQFNEIVNKHRNEWDDNSKGQEKYKQHVQPMLESGLFCRCDETNSGYNTTPKGDFYRKIIELQLGADELWIINLLCLLDGYYGSKVNHLIFRSKDINHTLSTIDYSPKNLEQDFKAIINCKKAEDIVDIDLFYAVNFFQDKEFSIGYFQASDAERKELKNYISNNIKEKKYNDCVIAQKMQPGGVYSLPTAIEEIKIFYVINQIILREGIVDIDVIIKKYSECFECEIDELAAFLGDKGNEENINKILENALENVFDDSLDEIAYRKRLASIIDRPHINRDAIKEFYQHKCSLSNDRKCTTFKAKKDGKPYVEIHHLIPVAFANKFSKSIDVMSNYVLLCPNCHQFMHRGMDVDRLPLLKKLYDERKKALGKDGLQIPENEFLKLYDCI